MLEKTKKYKNSPLIEVVCEFIFDNTIKDFEKAILAFKKEIGDDYSEASRRLQITINQKSQQFGPTQFKHKEKDHVVQLSENLISINQLSPYSSWEDYLPLVLSKLSQLKKAYKGVNISRIKLRYINKIEIPETTNNLEEYFKYIPQIPNEVSQNLTSLRLSTEHLYSDNRDVMGLSLFTTPTESEGKLGFLLDISYMLVEALPKDVEAWLNEAHKNINTTFEAILTENCKALFD